MEPHEEVKLNDFNAHYQVLLGNIQDATQELDGIFARRDQAREDLSSLESQALEKSKELDALLVRAESIQNDLTKSQESLAQREASLEADKVAHAAQVASDLATIAESKRQAEEAIAILDGKLTSLKQDESDTQEIVDALHEEGHALHAAVENLKNIKTNLDEENAALLNTMLQSQTKHNQDVDARKKEIADLDGQVQAAKDAVARPHEILDAREKELDVRENDFEIRKLRFTQQFQAVYPDQTPNI